MAVFDSFYRLADGNFAELNTAMIALLPKKDGATRITDFRPISLPHNFSKLFAKILATRARRRLHEVISAN